MFAGTADRNLVARWSEKIEAARRANIWLDQKVTESVCYALSNQYSFVGPDLIPTRPDIPENASLLTFPLIARAIDFKVSKLSATKPIWDATAIGTSAKSIRSAEATETLLKWTWQVTDMDRKYLEWLWWMMVAPRAWLKIHWDGKGGRQFDEVVGVNPDGTPQMQTWYEGMPAIDVVGWWELVHDPMARWEGDWRWCSHGKIMSCDDAEVQFDGKRPSEEGPTTANRFWRRAAVQSLRDAASPLGTLLNLQSDPEPKCVVFETQIMPCKEFRQGAILWHSGEEDLKIAEPFPYEHGECTYVGASERVVGGVTGGDWLAHRAIDAQNELNAAFSQLSTHREIACDPIFREPVAGAKWEAMPRGAGRRLISDVQDGQEPGWMMPGQLGPEVVKSIEFGLEAFTRIMEVDTLSTQVSGDASGVARQAAIEVDESTLGQTRAAIAHALKRAGKQSRSSFYHKAIAERQVCVLGTDQASTIQDTLKKGDYEEDCEMNVTLQSSTVLSAAVRTGQVMQLMGNLPPEAWTPDRMETAVKAIQTGAIERMFSVFSTDEEFSNRQVARIKQTAKPEPTRSVAVQGMDAMGRPLPPLVCENLKVTEGVFRRYLNDDEFDGLDPRVQNALKMTWAVKKQALDQQEAIAAAKMMQLAASEKAVSGMTSGGAGGRTPAESPLTTPLPPGLT